MIAATFRPLPAWPYPPARRRRSRWTFRASWADTLELLDREIRALGGSRVIIAAGFRDQDLRLDGWPRSSAPVPAHPGVEISFDSKHGRLVYATDVCEWWQHNVRSIALGLEALRAVDRYGVTRRGEQYAGWRELTAGSPDRPTSDEQAWNIIAEAAGETPKDLTADEVQRLYRAAVRRVHPDAGGSAEAFQRVEAARRFLLEGGAS